MISLVFFLVALSFSLAQEIGAYVPHNGSDQLPAVAQKVPHQVSDVIQKVPLHHGLGEKIVREGSGWNDNSWPTRVKMYYKFWPTTEEECTQYCSQDIACA